MSNVTLAKIRKRGYVVLCEYSQESCRVDARKKEFYGKDGFSPAGRTELKINLPQYKAYPAYARDHQRGNDGGAIPRQCLRASLLNSENQQTRAAQQGRTADEVDLLECVPR